MTGKQDPGKAAAACKDGNRRMADAISALWKQIPPNERVLEITDTTMGDGPALTLRVYTARHDGGRVTRRMYDFKTDGRGKHELVDRTLPGKRHPLSPDRGGDAAR